MQATDADVFDPGNISSFEEALKRGEPMYGHLLDMQRKLVVGKRALTNLQNKNVVVIMGPTGAGKSTIANALIKGASQLKYDEETDRYTAR